MSDPRPQPAADRTHDYGAFALLCPYCGDEHVHPYVDGAHGGAEEYSSPAGLRGPWLAVPCRCEACRARWDVVLGFHKGNTFLCAVDPPYPPYPPYPSSRSCGQPEIALPNTSSLSSAFAREAS